MRIALLALVATLASASIAGGRAPAKWEPLFNGKDLTGWTRVNVAPDTFTVRDNTIISTGVPTGILRTDKMYENFIMELDWMHVKKGGNAGVYVWSDPLTAPGQPFSRAIEVQVIDGDDPGGMWTGHGDLFSIHGAHCKPDRPHPGGWERCLPSERRSKPAGQWNHYRIECRNGRLTLAVNGKVVSGVSNATPRKGYICLESEGSECHFKNLRIQELPSTNPAPQDIAQEDQGFKSLYTGVDMSGWKLAPNHVGHFTPKDWIINYDGKSGEDNQGIWSKKSYKDFIFTVDWRLPNKPYEKDGEVVLPSGDVAKDENGKTKKVKIMEAGDSGIFLRGSEKCEPNIWCQAIGSGDVTGYRTDRKLSPEVRAAVTPKVRADNPPGQWNRFVFTMRGDRLTVVLNGKTIIENAELPGIPAEGPVGLQHHGDPIEFANLYIKEL
jgi:hypothetical protein